MKGNEQRDEEASNAREAQEFTSGVSAQGTRGRVRIGIVQCITKIDDSRTLLLKRRTKAYDDSALRFLILSMNSLQSFLQFEFVPYDNKDEFLVPLLARGVSDRPSATMMRQFYERQNRYLQQSAEAYEQPDERPNSYVVVSSAHFSDNYFYTSDGDVSIIALGGFQRAMAPPSILEFIQVLVLEAAVFSLCPELDTHIGTRGCLMDFAAILSDARQKVLTGFICQTCESVMSRNGYEEFVPELRHVLSKEWLGSTSKPASPAGIISNLGHDLFTTRGLEPSKLESAKSALAQEGTKQVLIVVGTVLAAVLGAVFLALLGYGVLNVHVSSVEPGPSATTHVSVRAQPQRSSLGQHG
jgi:hypothetical protein